MFIKRILRIDLENFVFLLLISIVSYSYLVWFIQQKTFSLIQEIVTNNIEIQYQNDSIYLNSDGTFSMDLVFSYDLLYDEIDNYWKGLLVRSTTSLVKSLDIDLGNMEIYLENSKSMKSFDIGLMEIEPLTVEISNGLNKSLFLTLKLRPKLIETFMLLFDLYSNSLENYKFKTSINFELYLYNRMIKVFYGSTNIENTLSINSKNFNSYIINSLNLFPLQY
ncbi:hypothetical protein DAPK24_037800 [Pichia kluyveri]|uniref:Uncharacterized protein n=1 Tax=Pichia kluyveri TaxID=36015 RepID=A0AAV5R7D2_PICKL|nr:hypothetical protein DAPK24_037800 [Pichia kluyveri]